MHQVGDKKVILWWTVNHSSTFTECSTKKWPLHGFSSSKHRYLAKSTIQQLVKEWRLTGSLSNARQQRNNSVNTVIHTDTTTGLRFGTLFCNLYFCKYYTNPLLICLSQSQNRWHFLKYGTRCFIQSLEGVQVEQILTFPFRCFKVRNCSWTISMLAKNICKWAVKFP